MIDINNWLTAVIQLFDHTVRALLGEAFFSAILQFLVILMVISLLSAVFRTSRKI